MADILHAGQISRRRTGQRQRARRAGAAILILGGTTIAAAPAARAAPSAAATRWTVERTPNPAGAKVSVLSAVSCPSRSACVAVGRYMKKANLSVTLAETWNGARWRIQPTPNPPGSDNSPLYGVSCASRSACTAVGYYDAHGTTQSFAEAWNGSAWHVQAVPRPSGASSSSLYGVSCTASAACTAVGNFTRGSGLPQPLAERWNGKDWRIQAIPVPRGSKAPRLWAVSCTRAGTCTAVGNGANKGGEGQPLAEGWNGSRWAVQPTPLPAGDDGGVLVAVSCTALDACTATGSQFAGSHGPSHGPTLADRWNGKHWQVQRTPSPPNYKLSFSTVTLVGVACTRSPAARCAAIGTYTPNNVPAVFAEGWNGTRWSLQTVVPPTRMTSDILNGVSCACMGGCTAVGAYTEPSGVIATLALTSSG